jgi:(2R)-sulfolactate sulfo-lyase subunit alpha
MHHRNDDVAIAVAALEPGAAGVRALDDPTHTATLEVREPVPLGHKVATHAIPAHHAITEYGEPIGRATAEVGAGEHVHTHNLVSLRWPGAAEDAEDAEDTAC